MKNRKRKNTIMLLLILVLGITIGFAALATTLKINGTANITKNTWNIYWANPVVTTGSVTTTAPTLSAESEKTANTIATWTTSLNLPGDFYEFTIDAVNEGTIDAMITNVIQTVTDGNDEATTLPDYISYKVTYLNGSVPVKYQLLKKANGATPTIQKYKVRVEFLDTITPAQMDAIPQGGLTYKFSYQVTYGQSTDIAYDGTYSDLEFSDTPGISGPPVYIGDTLASGTTTPDYTTLTTGMEKKVFSGFKLDSNRVVEKAYACGIYNNQLLCIEGPGDENTFERSKELLPTIYGKFDSTTNIGCYQPNESVYVCYDGDSTNAQVYVSTNSNVYVKSGIPQSQVFPGGPNNAKGGAVLSNFE